MKIFLCGFMGTGKTSVGKVLAKKLNLEFIDMDKIIEEREKMSIPEIFKIKGEPYFRNLEKELVKELVKKENVVVACGGGVVCNQENLEILQNNTTLILLEADPSEIYNRTKSFTHRPLLNVPDPQKRIKELLEKRAPFYQKVKIKVDTTHKSIQEVAEEIIKIVCKKDKS